MTASGKPGDRRGESLALLEPVVRRVIAARVKDRDLADDLVKETLARVLAAQPKLEYSGADRLHDVSARRVGASHFRQLQ